MLRVPDTSSGKHGAPTTGLSESRAAEAMRPGDGASELGAHAQATEPAALSVLPSVRVLRGPTPPPSSRPESGSWEAPRVLVNSLDLIS